MIKKSCLRGTGSPRYLDLVVQKTVAVDHVDFDFCEGEIISIVGESGSGKTTLAKMLLGLISVTEGEIYFQGKKRDISSHKKEKRILEKHSGDLPGSLLLLQYLQQDRCRSAWIVSTCAAVEIFPRKKSAT